MREIFKSIGRFSIKFYLILLIIIVLLLFFFLGIILIPRAFAQLNTVKSVEIFSENFDYIAKNPGSWKVDKSAKWIDKGEAEITFDVNTIMKTNTKYTDVLLVLDVSGSMDGDKLNRVKTDSIELIDSLLSNNKNRVGLITFNGNSKIISDFTNDKDKLISDVNSLIVSGNTNYYKALISVDDVLKNYIKESNRECIVLLLTDGFPCEDTPNEIFEYEYLKNQYPFIIVNGIQYEMGNVILDSISKVTDNQFIADIDTLNNVLFDASVSPMIYENFEIVDYIDTDYFYVENGKNIKVDQGNIVFDSDSQKVTWTMNNLRSGSKASMTIGVKLKIEYYEEGEYFSTNTGEEIRSKLGGDLEEVTSRDTPILRDNYKVIYDGNVPNNCNVENIPESKRYNVFDIVEISDVVPKCEGYQFKGWKISTEKVNLVNDDYFVMPDNNVVLRAVWSKIDVNKLTDGKVYMVPTIYNYMSSNFKGVDTDIDFSISPTVSDSGIYKMESTKHDKYPIYYYRGILDDNNVFFADYCWKIVRTTETGGVKLVYNGTPNNIGSCENVDESSFIGKSEFNIGYADSKYVGYTYDEKVNSTIKSYIDTWYANNISDYTEMLEDTVWCNDRSVFRINGSSIFYGVRGRLLEGSYRPSLECEENDKYTVNRSNGNGLLTYPIALLTADEVTLAGQGNKGYTSNGYLHTGKWWWLLSPSTFTKGASYGFRVYDNGQLYSNEIVNGPGGVRPAISLRNDVKYGSGNGSAENPYIILTD